jgi:hypothetical protein
MINGKEIYYGSNDVCAADGRSTTSFAVREQSIWKRCAAMKHERDRQHDLGTLM